MTSFTVFFLAFLVCSSLGSAEYSKYEKDVFEEYDNAVVRIRNWFEKLAGVYEIDVKKTFGDVAVNIHEAQMQISEELTKGLYAAMKNIENSQAQSDCIAKYISDVIAVYKKTQETQTACIQEAHDLMESISSNKLSVMQSVREDVANFIAELQGCSDEERTPEIGDLKLNIFFEMIKGKMNRLIENNARVIEENKEEITECPVTAKLKFFADVKKFMDKFVACN